MGRKVYCPFRFLVTIFSKSPTLPVRDENHIDFVSELNNPLLLDFKLRVFKPYSNSSLKCHLFESKLVHFC